MKKPNELAGILRSFLLISVIILCILFVVAGSLKAQDNSEYALSGKRSEHVDYSVDFGY